MKHKLSTLYTLRHFLAFWLSQTLSTMGSAMTNYALILWAFGSKGTASSVTLLAVFSYLPSVLLCFAAGTLADKLDKKRIILASDCVAALATLIVLALFATGNLAVWHLYIVNFCISLMNAFQNPASYVAVSLLAPKQYYTKVAAMQAFSNALVTVMVPVLATAVMAFGGLYPVLLLDLSAFLLAFTVLAVFIHLPAVPQATQAGTFWQECRTGLHFLRGHRALLKLILFFSFINLLASLTGNGLLNPMVLARTGGNQVALGFVQAAVGVGMLVGSVFAGLLAAPKNRTRVIFLSCLLSFLLCENFYALGRTTSIWVLGAFLGSLPLPFLNANFMTILRTQVPLEMQGRVFATRDTLQFATIPLGLLLAGFLADYAFEPFMAGTSALAQFFAQLVGTGYGSGMAVLFLLVGVTGVVACVLALKSKTYSILNQEALPNDTQG